MANTPRIGLIAVRSTGGPGGPYEALVIGTNDVKRQEWRYALCPVSEHFTDLLGDPNLFTTARAVPIDKFTEVEKADIRLAFADTDHGSDWLEGSLALDVALPFRNVVSCTFFRDTDEPPLAQFANPLARLDTCALDMPASGPESVGSFLMLHWAVPGLSSGQFRAVCGNLQTRLAIGGHLKGKDPLPGVDPSRFDPRHVFRFVAIDDPTSSTVVRSFWKPRAAGDFPRGVEFDLLKSGLTIDSWVSGKESDHRQYSKREHDDLFALTPLVHDPDPLQSKLDVFPVFSDLARQGLLEPTTSGAAREVARRCYYRVMAKDDTQPTRIGLRVELEVNLLGGALPLFNALSPAPVPSPVDKLQFAQEQRVDDIISTPEPRSVTRWLMTVSSLNATFDPAAVVMDEYERRRKQIHGSLRTVVDSAPLSFLPKLDVKFRNRVVPWQIVGQIAESEPWRRRTATTAATTEFSLPLRTTAVVSFEPCLATDFTKKTPLPVEPVTALGVLPRVLTTERRFLVYEYQIQAPNFEDPDAVQPKNLVKEPAFQPAVSRLADPNAVDAGTRFRVSAAQFKGTVSLEDQDHPDHATGTTGVVVDIDALRFRLAPVVSNGPFDPKFLNAGSILMRPVRKKGDDPTEIEVGLSAVFGLPVDRVDPAGQDAPPNAGRISALERRRGAFLAPEEADRFGPLIFPIGEPGSGSTPAYLLTSIETVTRKRDHSVSLLLNAVSTKSEVVQSRRRSQLNQAATPAAEGRLVLVIDPRPFRVVAVEYQDPATAATDEASQVAVRNPAGEGGLSWRVLDQSETVRILMPPQVIGEAMEKNRSRTDPPPDRPPDIAENRAAAVRFGSPTRVEIDPTFFDTAFREPGWNLRRILGFAGQRSPGSALRDLRLELAYGMTTRITPDGVSLSELSGIIGAPALPLAGAPPVSAAAARHFDLINAVITVEASRIAADKLWRGRPDADLRIDDRLQFRLRQTVKDGAVIHGPVTKLRWPVPGALPAPGDTGGLIDDDVLRATFQADTASPPSDSTSFPGGVSWAFESANIVMSVYGRPDSDGGAIQDVYLSALGGYGGQRALFDEKKTVVETETKQGRVHRYRLERIGRIGGLWNRAKHVIVYERTVVPSAQFFNVPPIDLQQDELAGRPVLRKVEEFVELIQPKRSYPEDGSSVSAAGCLVGAEFTSTKIRVDSRWGSDVRREGWRVPLWNKAFGEFKPTGENPDDPSLIYPKPQVRFLVAGESDRTIGLEVAEPEKLYFYTSVVRGESGDNTDLWRPVRDVDFVDLPLPVAGQFNAKSEDLTDAMLPSEPTHVPGFEQLTIGVVPSPEAVAIAHGRQDGGPVAVLKNVTVVRALATTGSSANSAAVDAGKVLAEVTAKVRVEIDRHVGRVIAGVDALDRATDPQKVKAVAIARVREIIGQIREQIRREPATAIAGLKEQLKKIAKQQIVGVDPSCAALSARLREQIDAQARRFEAIAVQTVLDARKSLQSPLDVATSELNRLEQIADPKKLQEEVQAFVDNAVLNRIRGVVDQLLQTLTYLENTVKATPTGLAAAAGAAVDDVTVRIVHVLENFKTGAQGVPAAIRAALDLGKAIEEAQSFRAKIRQLRSTLNQTSTNGVPDAVRRVIAAVNDTAGQLDVLITDAIKQSSATKESIAVAVEKGMEGVAAVLDDLLKRVKALDAGVSANLQGVLAEIDRVVKDAFAPLRKALELLRDSFKDLKLQPSSATLKDDVKKVAATVRKALDDAGGELNRAEAAATNAAQTMLNRAKGTIDGFVTEVTAACKRFEGMVSNVLANEAAVEVWMQRNLDAFLDEVERELIAAIEAAANALEDVRRQVAAAAADVARNVEGRARQLAGSVQTAIRDALGTDPTELADRAVRIYQQGDRTLRLIRAIGDPPKTDQLGFNRPEVGYVLDELKNVVDMTPALALVNRAADTLAAADQAGKAVGDLLQSFGIRLPMSSLGEQLIPEKLKQLSVANLFPDMAGIDFRGLLQRAGFPDFNDSKAIRITHGFDSVERRAWLEAAVDVLFTEALTLLEFGPVRIVIDEGRFVSQARFAAGRNGLERSMTGRISGDWRVVTGGQTMLTFRQTGLFFDQSGHLQFQIQPDRVELAAALQFLTNVMRATGKKGELVVQPFMRGAIPAGVAATLDIDIPPIQLGVFGISDLSLHVLFGIAALPQFEIVSELSVAARTAPFTLNVWLLNGGGYLTQRLSFLPMAKPRPLLTYTLDVGIVAGVGVSFSFGVVSGGVWLQVGCAIAITWTTGAGGNATAITVFILARGNVDVAGLITASIALLLEATYDGASMIGAGTLSISVKISVFFTLSVQQHVQYTFAGERRDQSDEYAEAHG